MTLFERSMSSPVGDLTVITDAENVTALEWRKGRMDDAPILRRATEQLAAYFAGDLTEFSVLVNVQRSAFQKSVCEAMSAIPFGETRTYGDLAHQLGAPAQAIGQACGSNPIPIIIPCHRVLGATSLGGFSGAGGVETKVALLRHEGAAGLLI